jgi:hypothetical protein
VIIKINSEIDLIGLCLYLTACSYTTIISVVIADKKVAVSLIPMLQLPFQLLSGYFVPESKVPWYLQPINYLSFFRYGFQAMYLNEYDGLQLECMEIPADRMGHCDPINDFKSPQNIEQSMQYLLLITIGCLALSYFFMRLLAKQER